MQQDRVIEVIATSEESFNDALQQGVEEATRAVQQMSEREIAGPLSNNESTGRVRYRVVMHIDFELEAVDADQPEHKGERAQAVGDRPSPMQMNPGDDAPLGTPGTGENICPTCSGSGEIRGRSCPTCGGSGIVVEAVGGA